MPARRRSNGSAGTERYFSSVVFGEFFVYTSENRIMGQILRITHRQRPELVTLSELRAKTDQQLHDLIRSKLDVGLSFAVLAEVEQTAGDRVFAEESLGRADRSLKEAQRLLPALNQEQRRWLEPQIHELRKALQKFEGACELPRTKAAQSGRF
jgi:hypothetical protein